MGIFNKKKHSREDSLNFSKSSSVPSLPKKPVSNSHLPPLDKDDPVNSLPNLDNKSKGFTKEIDDFPHPKKLGKPSPNFDINKRIASELDKPSVPRPSRSDFENRTLEVDNFSPSAGNSTKSLKPIFIRLDKFELTNQAFDEIKKKVVDLEGQLAKVREIKDREEKELQEWERSVELIKARIEKIDSDVFNKLD